MHRNYGCRLTQDLVYQQYRAIMLENEKLQIILLLDRGGEPIRFLHKASDTDFIWMTRLGLLPPHGLYPDYQMTYPGGWQEMMPEVSYTHTYRGVVVHRGETAVTPWSCEVLRDDPDEIHIRLTNRVRSLPLRVEKHFVLRRGEAKLRIEEQVTNEAPVQMETNWGHHLAYGAPFLDSSSVISFKAGAKVLDPISGRRTNWPHYQSAHTDEEIDLSVMPPAGTPRELLAVETVDGRYGIYSPERKLGLEVSWDQQIWPYIWYWQNFGADGDAPFFACEYNIGLEMFNVPPKLTLAEAVQSGHAIVLPPHGSRSAWLEFEVKEQTE